MRKHPRTPPTFCLAFSGTLVDGQVYLPGCWAIHAPKPGLLKKTAFGTPTVPLEFLGLIAHPRKT